MKITVLTAAALALVSFSVAPVEAASLNGAGSSFAYPILAKWAEGYKVKSGIDLNYQAIGSGGGIKQIESKTVDFGATDKPLDQAELDKYGLAQYPITMGGIVPVVNIKGIDAGKLKLTGQILADIYLGKITKWNDKAITEINKDLKLPDLAIAPVYRSDGSGTTYNFTYYLAALSPEWKDKVGVNTAVEFPVGQGGKGNDGVSAFTGRTEGAIGYVEYAYAKKGNLAYTLMSNKDGQFVEPSLKSFQAAAANADWAHSTGYSVILANQPGKESWPLTASTWVLLYKKQDSVSNGKELLSYFDYTYKAGQAAAAELDYVAIPDSVVALVEGSWAKEIAGADGKPLWP